MTIFKKIPRKELIGYMAGFSGLLLGGLSASCVQALEAAVPDFELSVARSIILVLFSLLVSRATGASITVNEQYLPALIFQGITFMLFAVGFFGATNYLPLLEATGLAVIASLVAAILHARWMYNKEITKSVVLSLCILVIGIVVTVQPEWMFSDQSISINTANSTTSLPTSTVRGDSSTIPGYVLGIIGGTAWGLQSNIPSNHLSDIEPIIQVFYFSVTSVVIAMAFSLYCEQPILVLNIQQYMLVLGHCVFSIGVAVGANITCYYIGGTQSSLVFSLEVVTMATCQYMLMTQIMPGHRNALEVVGCLITVVGVGLVPSIDLITHYKGSDQLP